MGVISHRDLFSSKYTTAIILNAGNRAQFVPITYEIGDYFLTDLNHVTYCFKIEGSRIFTYRETLTKSCKIIIYYIDNYSALSPKETKDLEKILTINSLPKVSYRLFNVFKALSMMEKQPFKSHNIPELIKETIKEKGENSEEVINTKNYLENLKIDKIITPVKKVTEFLEGELIATDPKFLGSIASAMEQTDYEHKKITNSAIGPKTAWLKWILILTIAILGIVLIYYLISNGAFSHILPQFPTIGAPSQQDLMKQYPTPESLKAAIDAGKVNYNTLPDNVKKMVDSVQTPTIEPTP